MSAKHVLSVPSVPQTLVLSSVYAAISASAFYLMYIQQLPVEIDKVWELHCPPGGGRGIGYDFNKQFTGIQSFDFTMCLLVTVFTKLLSGPARIINEPVILSLPAAWLPVVLDSVYLWPNNLFAAVTIPMLFGLPIQLLGGAIGLPLYWLLSLVIRLRLRSKGGSLPAVDEYVPLAVTYGIFIGGTMPSVIMAKFPGPQIIAFWQFFPIYCAIVALVLAPILRRTHPGDTARYTLSPLEKRKYYSVQAAYIICALLPTLDHLRFVRKVILSAPSPLAALKDTYLPYPYVYTYASFEEKVKYGTDNEIKRSLQWDFIFIFIAAWLGGVWDWAFADVKSFVLAVALSVVGGAVFGPGFFMAAPYVVQAWKAEKRRLALEKATKTKKAK